MRWLDGITDEHDPGQTPGDGEAQEGLTCCSPRGRKESDTTGQLNDTTTERQQTISVKGHRVNILGTTGQAVCVTTTQLCGHSKCSHKTEGEDLKGAVFQQNLIPDAKT